MMKQEKRLEAQLETVRSTLQAAEERFRNVISKSADPILMIDDRGRIMFVNPAALRIFDKQASELISATFGYPVVADEKTEIEILRADGRRAVMEMRVTRTLWDEQPAFLAQLRDITERKLVEEELQHHKTELEAANKEMKAFVYSVSHDLRAPLRAIKGFTELLQVKRNGKMDEEEQDMLNRIHRSAKKMHTIIEDLLRLSQISRQEMTIQPVDLSSIAHSIIGDLRRMEPERQIDIQITEGLTTNADPRFIEIALSNLFGNAWKFTKKNANARIVFGTDRDDGQNVYYIRDNGAGFQQMAATRLFMPFQRLHTQDQFEGIGIGLAIVERVIQRHQGKIWGVGEPDQGATFFFTLGRQ